MKQILIYAVIVLVVSGCNSIEWHEVTETPNGIAIDGITFADFSNDQYQNTNNTDEISKVNIALLSECSTNFTGIALMFSGNATYDAKGIYNLHCFISNRGDDVRFIRMDVNDNIDYIFNDEFSADISGSRVFSPRNHYLYKELYGIQEKYRKEGTRSADDTYGINIAIDSYIIEGRRNFSIKLCINGYDVSSGSYFNTYGHYDVAVLQIDKLKGEASISVKTSVADNITSGQVE